MISEILELIHDIITSNIWIHTAYWIGCGLYVVFLIDFSISMSRSSSKLDKILGYLSFLIGVGLFGLIVVASISR